MEPMFLKDVEAHHGDDNYSKAIEMMRRAGPEYPQILHMFSYKIDATVHLDVVEGVPRAQAGDRQLDATPKAGRLRLDRALEAAGLALDGVQARAGDDRHTRAVGNDPKRRHAARYRGPPKSPANPQVVPLYFHRATSAYCSQPRRSHGNVATDGGASRSRCEGPRSRMGQGQSR